MLGPSVYPLICGRLHPVKTVALDPGETTGYSTWLPETPWKPQETGQERFWTIHDALCAAAGVHEAMLGSPHFRTVLHRPDAELVRRFEGWDQLIVEDWALYPDPKQPGKLILPAWDKCRTARFIGACEALCRLTGKRIILQPASIKSDALKASAGEAFDRPLHENRHANDSIMHWYFYAATEGLLRRNQGPS